MKKIFESKWLPGVTVIMLAALFVTFSYMRATTATTTIGTNISTGGTLNVSGAAYASSTLMLDGASAFNGSNTFGNAAADINLFTGKLQASTTALFTGAVTLYNATTTLADGTTLSSGSMDGTTLRSIYIVPKSSTGATQRHKIVQIDGTFGASAYYTYGLVVGFNRDAVAGAASFDGTDTGLDIRV